MILNIIILLIFILLSFALFILAILRAIKVIKNKKYSKNKSTFTINIKKIKSQFINIPDVQETFAFHSILEKTHSFLDTTKKLDDDRNIASYNQSLSFDIDNIWIDSFNDYVGHMSRNDNAKFIKQWEQIISAPPVDASISQLKENFNKNRYGNIVPSNESRVILNLYDEKYNSDFINASYLPSYSSNSHYIATQGPKASTVIDFYRMIYDLKIKTVVMLTNYVEGGKNKCFKYIPDENSKMKVGDDFVIKTGSLKKTIDFEIGMIEVIGVFGTVKFKHFHYRTWPDHGVPKSFYQLINLRKKVRKWHNDDTPMVVHCSAGVGRTGTFFAMDYNLQREENGEKTYEITKYILRMRKNRPHMVQTEIQFVFLHDLLLNKYLKPRPEMGFKEFKFEGNMALKSKPNRIVKQFQKYKITDKNTLTMIEMNKTESNIKAKVKLSGASRDFDLLDAAYIDSKDKEKLFISSYQPQTSNIKDLVRLIYEKSISVVVQLGPSLVDYESGDFGRLTISEKSTEDMEKFQIKRLAISGPTGVKIFTYYKYLSYNYEQLGQLDMPILEFIMKIYSSLRAMTEQNLCCMVHSKGLDTINGVFIGSILSMESIENDMENINIMDVVDMLRHSRATILPEEHQILQVIEILIKLM